MDPQKHIGAAAPPLEFERRRPQLATDLLTSSSESSGPLTEQSEGEVNPAPSARRPTVVSTDSIADILPPALTITNTSTSAALKMHQNTELGSPSKVDVTTFLSAQEHPQGRDSGLHDASYNTSLHDGSSGDRASPISGEMQLVEGRSRRPSGESLDMRFGYAGVGSTNQQHPSPDHHVHYATHYQQEDLAPSEGTVPSDSYFEGSEGGVRLYYQGVAKDLRKQEMLQAKRIENFRRQERREQCTFQPLISPHARSMRRPRALSPENRALGEVLRKKEYLAQRRREVAIEELKGCTFHPLTLSAANLDPTSALRRYTVHQDLHAEHETRQHYRTQVLPREAQELEDEVLYPKFAPVKVSTEEVTSIVDRLLASRTGGGVGTGYSQRPPIPEEEAPSHRPELAPRTQQLLSERSSKRQQAGLPVEPQDVVDRLLYQQPQDTCETGVAAVNRNNINHNPGLDSAQVDQSYQGGTQLEQVDVRLGQIEHAFFSMVQAADGDGDLSESVKKTQHRADGGVKDLHLARGATMVYPSSAQLQEVMSIIVRSGAGSGSNRGEDGATFITPARFTRAAARALREGVPLTFFRTGSVSRAGSGEVVSGRGGSSSSRGVSASVSAQQRRSLVSKQSAQLTKGRTMRYDQPTRQKYRALHGEELLPSDEIPLDADEYTFAPKLTPYSGDLPAPPGWEIHSHAALERAQRMSEYRRQMIEDGEAEYH